MTRLRSWKPVRRGRLWFALLLGMLLTALATSAESLAADEAVAARDAGWLESFRRSREALAWTDLAVRHDWRLQRHAGDGRHRILDPADAPVCSGSEAECRRAFAALEADGTIPLQAGPTVILLHGLGESRGSMRPLADHLRTTVDATVISFGYASVKADLDDHGQALGQVVAGLPPATTVSFVGHSLGNLVVRRWMALAAAADLDRVGRMVMLGPPNQGSRLARMASGIWGVAGHLEGSTRELVLDWQRVAPRLAVPPCEFGIVAGGRGDDIGYSRLLAGDDDAIVCVDETRLEGARDFLLLPVRHVAMMKDPAVQRATVSFLERGSFADASAETSGPEPALAGPAAEAAP
jgi:pimeloyl-ACP methyl ester carboxylesterase